MDRANSEHAAGGAEATDSADSTASTTAAGDTDASEELAKDDLFHVLQNQRRRRVLAFLRDAGERVDMRDIAEWIAARESGKSVESITSEERQRAYIALYQSHLPKLDEMGIVDYDQDRGTVERAALATQFDPYLGIDGESVAGTDTATDPDPNSGSKTDAESDADSETGQRTDRDVTIRYYGAATLLGGVLTVASAAGLGPAVPSGVLAGVVTGLFVLVTLAVAYERQR